MDGNGRWAKKRKFPRVMGHKNAIKAVKAAVETSSDLGVEVLTLYAFSTENWGRPSQEVDFLMKLFTDYLTNELDTLLKNNVRFCLIGNKHRLPAHVHAPLERALQASSKNTGMRLCVAIDYGSRDEITQACRHISEKVKNGEISIDEIDEAVISDHLFTREIQDPELIIRTSGELRLSNFLLWQAAYAEFYFTPVLWPDFNKEELYKAIIDFQNRDIRKGKIRNG